MQQLSPLRTPLQRLVTFGLLLLFPAIVSAQSAPITKPALTANPTTATPTTNDPINGTRPAGTQMAQNSASILMRWVDARGVLYQGGKITKMAWTWSRYKLEDPTETPALRIWISSHLPADWKPTKVSGDGLSIYEPFSPGATQTMAIDLRSTKAVLRFEFVDQNNVPHEMTLALHVTAKRPYILIRPECAKQDLKFVVHKSHANHLFVGLDCSEKSDSFDIYFFRSPKDSTWNTSEGLIQFDPENKFNAFKYNVKKPKTQVVYSQRLFRVGTVDEQNNKTEFSVVYNPKVPPKRFYMSAGVGATAYNYQEEYGDVRKSQYSLTGKLNLGYRIIPRVLDIAFNGFSNLVTLAHGGTADLPEARFYGINGRIGYRLPLEMGAVEFMFLTGWYFWGMLVADDGYGIKALSGPQLFVTMINSQAGHAGWWAYFKYAMIADKFNYTGPQNHELAVGGGLELSARETKPFSFTIDIARAQFSKEATKDSPKNGMKLFSITAGVQKSF